MKCLILSFLLLAPLAVTCPILAQVPKASAKKKVNRPQAVGPAIGANVATPVSNIKTLPDFKVELIYSVPGGEQGSWVNLTTDDAGRIYVSDQYGMLYRFKAPAAGATLSAGDIEKVPADIRGVNGMLFAFGALYVGVNDYEKKIPSGVYRITDSNSDDMPDKVEMLREFDAGSDHGVHAILKTPDGKSLYLISGNNAVLKEGPKAGTPDSSPVAKLWGDDHLLPRMPDGRGHNRHVMAPGGIVYRFTPDGKTFEIFASGFRNIYDGGVNRDGELFVYDADMEYDFNTSWYRPTRINHVVSGAEFGWRNGAGKYPEFYIDNLPATLNIGPGSPTGCSFGYGAKFPAKYQRAFFALDWSWGKIYAVHLEQQGASYKGTKEEFVTGAPLPVTDVLIHPKDGAMYFAIGGRRVQSGLYRVTYTGSEDTAPGSQPPPAPPPPPSPPPPVEVAPLELLVVLCAVVVLCVLVEPPSPPLPPPPCSAPCGSGPGQRKALDTATSAHSVPTRAPRRSQRSSTGREAFTTAATLPGSREIQKRSCAQHVGRRGSGPPPRVVTDPAREPR